jgi:hypothetical protein
VEYRGEVLADFPWYVQNFAELSDMHLVRNA